MRYAPSLLTFLVALLLCGCDEPEQTPTCPQDCASTGQVCDTQTLACVQCLFPSDCGTDQTCANKACVPANAVTCVHDDHCAGQAHPFCSSLGRCEWDCLTAAHCAEPPDTLCDPESHTCISASTSSGADASDPDAADPSDVSDTSGAEDAPDAQAD